MSFNYCPGGYVLEVVSIRRSKTTRKEEVDRITTGWQEKKGYSKGEVYKKQETSEPCIYLS